MSAIDVNTGKCLQWFPAKVPEQYYYQTRCVSVSRDGNYVATAEYESRIVTIFDMKTGEMMHEYDAKFWGSGGIAFSPTDDIIAIGAGSAIVLLKYDG